VKKDSGALIDGVTIKNLEVKNFCHGIWMQKSGPDTLPDMTGCLIECCKVHDNGDCDVSGSQTHGIKWNNVSNSEIRDCEVYNQCGDPDASGPPGAFGIYLCGGDDNEWHHNEVYDTVKAGLFLRCAPWRAWLHHNYLHDNPFAGIRCQCVHDRDFIVEYNLCIDNVGPGSGVWLGGYGIFFGGADADPNIARYNICKWNRVGIAFEREAWVGEVYGNTACENIDYDIYVQNYANITGNRNACDNAYNYTDADAESGCLYACEDGPQADFSADPESGIATLLVQFNDESVGMINTWSWDFDDGETSDERNPVHIYNDTGSYTPSLRVSGDGGTDTETKPAYINVTAIYAEFFADKTKVLVPFEVVEFTDNSTSQGTVIVEWHWDFGDGGTSTDQNATHEYENVGSYDVSLTVYSSEGRNIKIKKDYIQAKAVIADFTFDPVEGYTPLEVQFTDKSLSSGGIESWSWDFGDGSTISDTNSSIAQNPKHEYRLPGDEVTGSYTPSLTVTGGGGNDTQTKDSIILARKIKADFSAEPRTGDAPLTVQFTNLSTGFISSFEWDFGDGETSIDESPSHTYNYSGNYTVSLEAKHSYWEDDTETKQGYILVTGEQKQVATPTFSPASGTTFTDSLAVEISCTTSGASIYYTADGSDPTESSTPYTGSITLTGTTTLKAKAFKADMEPSEVATATYTKTEEQKVATPTFSPASGATFTDSLAVAISCATSDASIYYTTDGSNPTESSTPYTSSITLTDDTTTIKAKAFKTGMEPSEVASATYTKTEEQQVATPTFSSASGTTFTDSLDVEISCATSGASIYYTTDGSDPTDSSTSYTGSITLNKTTTFKAKAFKTGMEPSEVASATYTSASSSVADFWASPRTGTVPLTVSFRDFSTGKEIESWYWKFGDGKISREQNLTHTYLQHGSFTVSLTIASPDGNAVKTKKNYITVTREQGK
jgi:PKD repeat protein